MLIRLFVRNADTDTRVLKDPVETPFTHSLLFLALILHFCRIKSSHEIYIGDIVVPDVSHARVGTLTPSGLDFARIFPV